MSDRGDGRRVASLVRLLEQIQQPDQAFPPLERFREEYARAQPEERRLFFETTVRRLEVSRESIGAPLQAVLEGTDEGDDAIGWSRRVTGLRRALESPRLRAFRRFLNSSGGLAFLLGLRADVLDAQRETASLDPLDEEIAHLIDNWFQHGFLFLKEITRDSSFREIAYLRDHELVHPLESLDRMAQRLGGDRRCFALYHLAIPEEPVVFIEVALTRGLAGSIHEILPEQDTPIPPRRAPDSAIFYSINNTQNGLAGIGLGSVLISQVVEAIRRDVPGIGRFATLSPIPGFWPLYLRPLLRGEACDFALDRAAVLQHFPQRSRPALEARTTALLGPAANGADGDAAFAGRLAALLDDPRWIDDAEAVELLRRPLTRLGWLYLDSEKNPHGRPLNPVARFHLGNGASISEQNVRFAGNRSPRGLAESCGLMVNYVYSLTWTQKIGRTMRALLPHRA